MDVEIIARCYGIAVINAMIIGIDAVAQNFELAVVADDLHTIGFDIGNNVALNKDIRIAGQLHAFIGCRDDVADDIDIKARVHENAGQINAGDCVAQNAGAADCRIVGAVVVDTVAGGIDDLVARDDGAIAINDFNAIALDVVIASRCCCSQCRITKNIVFNLVAAGINSRSITCAANMDGIAACIAHKVALDQRVVCAFQMDAGKEPVISTFTASVVDIVACDLNAVAVPDIDSESIDAVDDVVDELSHAALEHHSNTGCAGDIIDGVACGGNIAGAIIDLDTIPADIADGVAIKRSEAACIIAGDLDTVIAGASDRYALDQVGSTNAGTEDAVLGTVGNCCIGDCMCQALY